jgi:hypothetical protein
MNTRGIVQLVVLNIGVELGVLSPLIFSIFVLMATILTFCTSPILSLLYRQKYDTERVSVPNIAASLRNSRDAGINMAELKDNDDKIQTISTGDINSNDPKRNSIRSLKQSLSNLPVHDTFVTFDDRINYIEMCSSGQGTEEIDTIEDMPDRPIHMTRF